MTCASAKYTCSHLNNKKVINVDLIANVYCYYEMAQRAATH